jgi:predicted anti-sigma-YlaC factor YlaD
MLSPSTVSGALPVALTPAFCVIKIVPYLPPNLLFQLYKPNRMARAILTIAPFLLERVTVKIPD